MNKLIAANVNAGEDFIKLSFIIILTIKPDSIKINKPKAAIINNVGLK
jgi:hypothetical protein